MALEEYKRKRRFDQTPEPPPKVETKTGHRFVVQKHDATRLHYDFRLEMEGVLKSWAVPKGPSLDPADKRLAMQVEDHPVSYFDFEGIIPEDNYGAGTVMVWDVGTWQPLSPVAVQGKYVPGTEAEAAAMLAKGDLKFRLKGKKLNGDFALVKMKGRRPGSKGNEWLMIKKHDDHVVEGYDIDEYDESVLSKRSLAQIAGDTGSAEWRSRPAGRGKLKAAWLADAVAKLDQKKAAAGKQNKKQKQLNTAEDAEDAEGSTRKTVTSPENALPTASPQPASKKKSKPSASSAVLISDADAAVKRPMPSAIHPMLATSVDEPFDGPDWLFEIKWDGYRAIAFIENGKVRLVSRNQNDLTGRFPELKDLPKFVRAKTAILNGEVVALDEQGRASFSLMQQRTGFRPGGRRGAEKADVPVLYYAFDLLYLDGYDLRQASTRRTEGKARFPAHYAGCRGRCRALFRSLRESGQSAV